MNIATRLWNFTEHVSAERRQRLLAINSFDKIVERIACGNVDYFTAEPRQTYTRAFFRICVSEPDYDAFFNSPNGYRAQYCFSEENGEKQNRKLIDAVTPMCLEFYKRHAQREFPTEKVLASLRGVDAKAWITESDIPDVDEIHINYRPWVAKAKTSTKGPVADQAARAGASVGVLAPVGTHIEIKGGWLKPPGDEWLDSNKAFRAREIRDYGFA